MQNTGKKKQKPYDYLDKKGTTKTRQDFIETDYVNGVKNDKGELVIRPMNAEEREFLSQFIQETEHGNLNKTSQVKREVRVLKELRASHKFAKKTGDIDGMVELEERINFQLEKVKDLREQCGNFYTSEDDVKEIYTRDNARRRDVYNNAKISDKLVTYGLPEYDKFSTEAVTDINPEDLILEHLVYIPVRKKGKR